MTNTEDTKTELTKEEKKKRHKEAVEAYNRDIKQTLDEKIEHSIIRIQRFVEMVGGPKHTWISFSGGKDSTVLRHIVKELYGSKVPAVYIDAGTDFPEVRDFAIKYANAVIKPKKKFMEVVNKYGYPVTSKEQARYIYEAKHTKSEKLRAKRMYGKWLEGGRQASFKIADKWLYLIDALPVSDKCCYYLRKEPAERYTKQTRRYPLLGTLATESMTRKQDYIKNSCIRMGKRPLATPLAIWTEQDIWDYIKRHKVQTTDLYKMGYDRTGCAFCMFGVTREKYPNRFQRMYGTHPALHKTVCEKWGLRKVLEILDVDCYPNKNRCTTLRKQRDPNKTDQGPSPLSPT